MSKERVCIVGSGGEWSGLPVVRELGKLSYVSYLLFSHLEGPDVYSRYVAGKHKLVKESDQDLTEAIADVCDSGNMTHVICLNEDMKRVLVKNRSQLSGLRYAFPSFDNYNTAQRKDRSAALARKVGVPVPETTRITSRDELEELFLQFRKPVVVKGIRSISSNNVRYASSIEELVKCYEELSAIEAADESTDSRPILQEYIAGPTYDANALAQDGEVKVVVPHVKFREWPSTGGVTSRAMTIDEPRLVEYSTRMMEALNWHGEAGLEWKYHEERNEFYFIEMNPRFEGSLDIAVKAGVNLPRLLMKVMEGKKVPDDITFRPNTHYRWIFRDDFKFFLHHPYGLGRLLWETIDPRVHGEVTLDDPGVLKVFWKRPFREFLQFRLRGNGRIPA